MKCIEPYSFHEHENQVFNHNFRLPDTSGDFPAGWDKYTESVLAVIYWQKVYRDHYCVMISNPFHNFKASIYQQSPFYIPVNQHELWEVGARFKVYRKIKALITVHFIKDTFPVSSVELDFHLVPGSRYYSRSLSIPDDMDYAYIEIGTRDSGQIWIEDAVFTKLYPHPEEINVNMVEAVKKIIDPVKIEKITRDTLENVMAGPFLQTSDIQDVLKLSTYTYCVLNMGATEAKVRLQMSPDGINFIGEEMADYSIEPGKLRVLNYNSFVRYVRVAYWTEDGNNTPLRIFFQAQG